MSFQVEMKSDVSCVICFSSFEMQGSKSVKYYPSTFFVLSALIPIITVIGSMALAHSTGHLEYYPYFPSISQAVASMPESRLFCVGFVISALINLPCFILVYKVFSTKSLIEKTNSLVTLIWKIMIIILPALIFLSSMGFASITLKEISSLHCTFIGMYAVSSVLYGFVIDIVLKILRMKVGIIDWMFDSITALILIASTIMWLIGSNDSMLNSASVFSLIGSILIFGRFILTYFRMPSISLYLTRKPQ